jgi:NAD-dependent SIR2 family protein deacetylase
MRLIDADALIENYNLKNATKYGNRDAEQQNHSYSTMMLYEVADMIDDAPTIEAVPAVHGKWIGNTCSACGMNWDENMVNNADDWGYFEPMPNFCPNCGAKMIKESD